MDGNNVSTADLAATVAANFAALDADQKPTNRAHLFVQAPYNEKTQAHDHAALDKAVKDAAKSAGATKATVNSRTVDGADVVFEK